MKLCGCKEKCFVRGELWGHFSGTMCEHLGERDTNKPELITEDNPYGIESYCCLDGELINPYFTQEGYECQQ